MTVFISGGCKNGKSSIAEDVCKKLAGDGPLYYLATMQPYDDEDRERIKKHVAQRDGKGFETIEQQKNILEVLEKIDGKNTTFLLDSVTALMINELYGTEPGGLEADSQAAERTAAELRELCSKVKNIVFVSDYIYEEADNYSKYTKAFLEALSYTDKALADCCDVVCEVTYGNIEMYKGELPL